MLYNSLNRRGIRVGWYKQFMDDKSWEEGICQALMDSIFIVFIVSRAAIKNSFDYNANFAKLNSNSDCDKFLVEWRLALELKDRFIVEGIIPVLVGDVEDDGSYSNYFTTGCYPEANDQVVLSVEAEICRQLQSKSLGAPHFKNMTVKDTLEAVMSNKLLLVEGGPLTAIETVAESIGRTVNTSSRRIHTVSSPTSNRPMSSRSLSFRTAALRKKSSRHLINSPGKKVSVTYLQDITLDNMNS